jgi:hypothetical protein
MPTMTSSSNELQKRLQAFADCLQYEEQVVAEKTS